MKLPELTPEAAFDPKTSKIHPMNPYEANNPTAPPVDDIKVSGYEERNSLNAMKLPQLVTTGESLEKSNA